MKALLILIMFFPLGLSLSGQQEISGVVTDNRSLAIIGANVFIEGTYDGGITDIEGNFSFSTSEKGELNLQISYLGFESKRIIGFPKDLKDLKIELRESAMALDAVEITASTFKAGENSKVAVLKPLDILTTAGSMGDVIAAMQTLPGTQTNDEDGRLFVRGGDARETAIHIDGMRVFSPYNRTVGGSPTRGRYSPLLFKGVSFSTGGYASSFGQALSGVLDMNSIDEPVESVTNINLMSIGFGLGHTQKWNKQSLSVNGSYTNIALYDFLLPSRVNWKKPFASFSGEAIYRLKTKKGLLKTYIASDLSDLELHNTDFDSDAEQLIGVNNNNIYGNTTYREFINDKTSVNAGFSIGVNKDESVLDEHYSTQNDLFGYHARLGAKTILNDRSIVTYGADLLHLDNGRTLSTLNFEAPTNVSRNILGTFVEADYFFTKDLAIKTGLRGEYNSRLAKMKLLPRFTIAQKLNDNDQISAAYGWFDQEVDNKYLLINNSLQHEMSQHYIVNYNHKSDKQILRIDGYYKKYDDLISYDILNAQESDLKNSGKGYAYGIDFFYRADQVINNLDMWVSYSWLENKRIFKNYPIEAPTRFSTRHNISLVGKYFVEDWKSLLSLTYKMASGRPYHDPNKPEFMSERSRNFHSINASWSYLISQQKILFVSVKNATRFKNSYGYRFKSEPNASGVYDSQLIRPNDDQFFFVGFFITMSKNKLNNQLNNL